MGSFCQGPLWLLPFVKASLYKFFLSKNASETFCQGITVQILFVKECFLAFAFCQGISVQILFVKECFRNLLSRLLPFCQGLQLLNSHSWIHCQVQGGPSILGLLGDLVHLHTSCLCLHADRRVVVEDHLHIPPLADGHLPTFSCPHGHYGAVVHQPLLLQPLALVLHPLPLKVASEADHPDLHSQVLQPFEACSLPLQLMALDGLEPVHADPSWQFLLTRNCSATLLTRGCGFTLLTRGRGFTLLTRAEASPF